MGVLAGILSMVFWGTAIFLAALASRKIGNILTLFWMQVFGLIVAVCYFLATLHSYQLENGFENILILLFVAILQVVAYLSFYKGLEKGEVSLVSPIGATWGLLVVLLGVIFRGEDLKAVQVFSIVLIMGGIMILSFNTKSFRSLMKLDLSAGVKEGFIAMLGWGISLFLLSLSTEDLGWFLPTLIFRSFVIGILLTYIFFSKKEFSSEKKKFPSLLLIAIGAFDVAGFFSYSYGVEGEYASIVAPIGSAFALVSIILSFIFLREKVNLQKVSGIAAVIIGLVLISI